MTEAPSNIADRLSRQEFAGLVCVVTGGASGIGAAISRAFATRGGHVVILDLDRVRADELAAELPNARALACDIADDQAVESVFREIASGIGAPDVLVNNAGFIADEGYGPMLARREAAIQGAGDPPPLDATVGMTTAQWRRMLGVHLDGTFFCTRAALRAMQRRRRGAIVNMSSVIGIDGGEGIPHYAAAKAGILGLTRAVAREVAPLGIRVNAVAPGFVDTGMRDLLPPTIAARQLIATPMARLAQASEIADAVLYLAGPDASFVTGQVLGVNGGFLSR